MSDYYCPRCGYTSKYRYNIRKHFNRSKPCTIKFDNISIAECFRSILNEEFNNENKTTTFEDENDNKKYCHKDLVKKEKVREYECEYCSKKFSHRNSRNHHIKRCRDKDINEKEKIIKELKSENELLKNTRSMNIQNNNITTNNIIINAFGKENLDYIKKEYIHSLIQAGPYASIQKLIKHIHFNPNHKENHNIKIPNKRDKYGMVFDGKTWQIKNKKTMITTIADHAYGIIAEHCEDLDSKKLDKFREDYENEDMDLMKRITNDTELVILNGQKEIGLI